MRCLIYFLLLFVLNIDCLHLPISLRNHLNVYINCGLNYELGRFGGLYPRMTLNNEKFTCLPTLDCIVARGEHYGPCTSRTNVVGVCCRLPSPSPPMLPQYLPPIEPTIWSTTESTDLQTTDSSLTDSLNCGQSLSSEGRVVGGTPSRPGHWPWMVSVQRQQKHRFEHMCGASLVAKDWILTAAHCVYQMNADQLGVRLGLTDLRDNSPSAATRNVSLIVVHPQFDSQTFFYDVALLKLDTPVQLGRNFLPVCLPISSNSSFDGKGAKLLGWGRLSEDGQLPLNLQEADMVVVSNRECMTEYRRVGYEDIISQLFICTESGREAREDACQGDSGGPLVTLIDNQWFLIGTVSWGIGTSCARPNEPTIFARTTEFIAWIKEIIY